MTEEDRLEKLQAASSVPYTLYKSHDKHYFAFQDRKTNELWLKIPPGGFIHRHTDKAGIRRLHILQTNDEAVNYMEGEAFHLEEGGIYDMDGRIEHWAVNDGSSDRIHYIQL